MSEITLYEAQAKKMQGICDEHNLTYRFLKDRYPIIFIIRPIQGMDAQISMLEAVEEAGYISPEAEMMWIFKDGALETRVTGGTFTISKTLRTKIESILMKMITYWQQYFFKDVLEKHSLAAGMMPVISEEEAADDEYEEDAEGINEEAEAEMDDVTSWRTRMMNSAILPTILAPPMMTSTIRLSALCAWRTRRLFLSSSAA